MHVDVKSRSVEHVTISLLYRVPFKIYYYYNVNLWDKTLAAVHVHNKSLATGYVKDKYVAIVNVKDKPLADVHIQDKS